MAGKVDHAQLDCRPTPKQRSTIGQLRYLSVMGPALIPFIKAGAFDQVAWKAALNAANPMEFDDIISAIGKQTSTYAELLERFAEADFRGGIEMLSRKASRGSFVVNLVLSACAAYRAQLFMYLNSYGRDELSTANLWAGMDAPAQC